MKKSFKQILLCIAVIAMLAAFALVLASCKDSQEQTAEPQLVVGWNVDRKTYVAQGIDGKTSRPARSDGYYYVRLAVDGEQLDYKTNSLETINHIDMLELCVLRVDENNEVLEVMDPRDYEGGLAIDHMYVEAVNGQTVTCNTDSRFQGVQKKYNIPETAAVYNVGGSDLLVGMPGTVSVDDEIIALQDEAGNITRVYVMPYQQPGDVYWNLNRQYDNTLKRTLREPDASGCFTFEMACNGEVVTVKTKDQSVANAIDKTTGRVIGLTFDENGLVVHAPSALAQTGGSIVASYYHVLQLNDEEFTARKATGGSDGGRSGTFYFSKNCKVINVTSEGELGAYTELRVGDQVHCLTDSRGQVCYAFVVGRIIDSPLYWNVTRKYDSATKQTTRTPAADGYYYFTLATGGKQVTLKTKDKSVASDVDSFAAQCFGLRTDGDIILDAVGTVAVNGGSYFGSWYDITAIGEDGTITAKRILSGSDQGTVITGKMADDCEVYNVSAKNYRNFIGEATELQVGDRIHGLTDMYGDVACVYVVSRPIDAPLYWNLVKYGVKNGATTRKPAADGYYYFELATGGKAVTLKTNDDSIAYKIDSTAARCFGLKVRDGVIVDVYSTSLLKDYNGICEVSWADITKISPEEITAHKYLAAADQGKSFVIDRAPNCNIYNVSNAWVRNPGEATSLQIMDRVHCLRNTAGQTTAIFVVSRELVADVYWNIERKYDNVNKTTTRTPDAEGWYYLDMAVNGQQVTLKAKDVGLVNSIDSNAARCRALMVVGDEITSVMSTTMVPEYAGGVNGSWATVTEIDEDGTIHAYDGSKIIDIPVAEGCKYYNVSSVYDSHVGEECTVKVTDQVHVLVNSDKLATLVYVVTNGKGPQEEVRHEGHCVCGGVKPEGHTCQEDITWIAWGDEPTETKLPTAAGHYYLTTDIDRAWPDTISADVTLYLNGFTITSSSSAGYRLLNVGVEGGAGGTFTLCDCTGNGVIKDTTDLPHTVAGRLIAVHAKGTFNMYGGKIEGGEVQTSPKNIGGWGGNIYNNGVFNMYGGCVTGGSAKANEAGIRGQGGNLYVSASGKFNMYGGTIENGIAAAGGNIYTAGSTMLAGKVTVTGATDGGNLYVPTGKIIDGAGLLAGSVVGITAEDSVSAFATVATETQGALFTPDADGCAVVYDGGKLTLQSGHIHCICGGTKPAGHVCKNVNFLPWDGKSASGTYYVTEDMDISDVTVGGELVLCLNGCTVTSSGRAFVSGTVSNKLSVTDCVGSGVIQSANNSKNGGLMFFMSGTLELYGGTLQKTHAAAGSNGMVVKLGNNASTGGTFNMYGGTVQNGSSTANGGNIVALGKSVINIQGGTVQNGTTSLKGANIYIGGTGKHTIANATVKDGNATGTGDNILIEGGTLTVDSCNIEGGSGICILSGTVTLTGKLKLDCTADTADIYMEDKTTAVLILENLTGTDTFVFHRTVTGQFATADSDYTPRLKAFDQTKTIQVAEENGKFTLQYA